MLDVTEQDAGADGQVLEDFRRAEALQVRGDIAGAVEGYRRVGAALPRLLARPGRDGRPVTGPDFLVIGAPRAGTTWLKQRLARHPEVFIQTGEGDYFAYAPYRSARDYVASFAGVAARFLKVGGAKLDALRDPGAPKVLGEKGPAYMIAPDVYIDLCATLFPDVRLICTVREPVGRAWSHIKHWDLADRAEAMIAARRLGEFSPLDEIISYGRYLEHLKRWRLRFPSGQFLLVDFRRIADDPDGVYREVLQHLGATPRPVGEKALGAKVGGSGEAPAPRELMELLARAYEDELIDVQALRRALDEAPGPA